jgi:hypothetical protein
MSDTANTFRFQVALSFPGGYRARVEKIAEVLADRLGRGKILYDKWYGAEFARPNLDVYLPELYHKESLLLVFFLSSEYVTKEWCGLEWRAGRDLLKQGEDDRLMFLRLDHADIPGLYSIVEVADFNELQIQTFATRWFGVQGEQKKAAAFVEKLKANRPILDLASSPLLLTLLCLVFQGRNDFEGTRAELYREGLDVLLRKWDAKRGIERDRPYGLSITDLENLLGEIAYRRFLAGEYFFVFRVSDPRPDRPLLP